MVSGNIPSTQSITSPNYSEPASTVSFPYPMSGNLGFLLEIAYEPPNYTPWYAGENALPGRSELVTRGYPRAITRGGVDPWLTENIPLVDIRHPLVNYDPADYTYEI